MTDVTQTGNAAGSKFLQYFKDHPTAYLSLNFNTNGHNNAPPEYRFSDDTFQKMQAAGVPASVLAKMAPMKKLFQNAQRGAEDGPANPANYNRCCHLQNR